MFYQLSEKKKSGFALSAVMMVAAITVFAAPHSVHAGDSLAQINIRLMGTVTALGCTVDPGDVDKPVKLGEWATKQLKNTGDTTTPVPFSIHLLDCTANGVTAAFTGTKDKKDNSLLALSSGDTDSAQGVAVQIMDSARKRIPMGDNAPRETIDDSGDITLSFYANYMVTDNESVKPGTADANTEFTLTYD